LRHASARALSAAASAYRAGRWAILHQIGTVRTAAAARAILRDSARTVPYSDGRRSHRRADLIERAGRAATRPHRISEALCHPGAKIRMPRDAPDAARGRQLAVKKGSHERARDP